MAIVKFGDVVKESKNKIDRNNNPYDYYIAGDHMDSEDLHLHRKGCFATDDVGPAFIREFLPGQILYGSRRTYLKKVAVADFAGVTANTTFVLETKDENVLRQRLIPFIMLSEGFTEWSVGKSKGSTNPYVLFSDLADYEFNLPEIEKQDELVELLWSMDNAVVSYKRAIDSTEELVKSQFIEMFGKVKEYSYLEDCCSIHARVGWQALKKDEHTEQGEYMLITGTDFCNGSVDYSTCVYVSKERYDMDEKIQVRNGDILVTKDGTIGKVAVVEGLDMPATLNAGVFVIRPDGKFNSDYFSYLFKGPIFSTFVESVKSGSTIKHLNQRKLEKYKIPQASIEMQTQFAELYKQSDKSKFEMKDAIDDVNAMRRKIVEEYLNKA